MTDIPKIIYTETDEAPRLATYSMLPIIKAFTDTAGVEVEMLDISLAGRIISAFPEYLTEAQRIPDHLAALGEMTQRRDANIIKLPNISASNPQMQAAIVELQSKGYGLPDYVEEPKTDQERENKLRYDRVKGSAVNPVLREGNSDRRAAKAVKDYAQKHPHRMGAWASDSKTSVVHMQSGDFYGSERSVEMAQADQLAVHFKSNSGEVVSLADAVGVSEGEVVDAAVMGKAALVQFWKKPSRRQRIKGYFGHYISKRR